MIDSRQKVFLLAFNLIAITATSEAGAVCGQNRDAVVLERNGQTIAEPLFAIFSQPRRKPGLEDLEALCFEGRCSAPLYLIKDMDFVLVEVTDRGLLDDVAKKVRRLKAKLARKKDSTKHLPGESFPRLVSKALSRDSGLEERLKKVVSARVPIRQLKRVPNRFTFKDCGYRRRIAIDVDTGEVTKAMELDGSHSEDDFAWKDLTYSGRSSCRQRQAVAKVNLKAIFGAQAVLRSRHGRYASELDALEVDLARKVPLYDYRIVEASPNKFVASAKGKPKKMPGDELQIDQTGSRTQIGDRCLFFPSR